MRSLLLAIPLAALTLASVPAAAQRFNGPYPVCMQKWEWGGSSSISCNFTSWDACRAEARGLSAMCLANPYVPQANPQARAMGPAGGWGR